MMRGLATAALATGCLSVPAYEPERSVSYSDDASDGATVAGQGFALRFAADGAFRFPDRLTIDGNDVMGHESEPSCSSEDETGFLLAPTPRISAHGDAPALTNQLVPVLRGPAVVQLKLDWATRLECSSRSERSPGGTSTFTVFPDGRIVRHDLLVDPGRADVSAFECACGADSSGFTVASYWTFAPAPFRNLHIPGRGALQPGAETIANAAAGCLEAAGYQLALAWHDPGSTRIGPSGTLIEFGRYLGFGDSILDIDQWTSSSAIFIERTSCDAALVRAEQHFDPPPLSINGTAALPSPRDGIYGGDSGAAAPGIPLATDRVELTAVPPPGEPLGAVNSSFAVWLRFPRAHEALRATLEGATGAWYLPQRVNDHEWIVWFRDPIVTGQTIVVEPR